MTVLYPGTWQPEHGFGGPSSPPSSQPASLSGEAGWWEPIPSTSSSCDSSSREHGAGGGSDWLPDLCDVICTPPPPPMYEQPPLHSDKGPPVRQAMPTNGVGAASAASSSQPSGLPHAVSFVAPGYSRPHQPHPFTMAGPGAKLGGTGISGFQPAVYTVHTLANVPSFGGAMSISPQHQRARSNSSDSAAAALLLYQQQQLQQQLHQQQQSPFPFPPPQPQQPGGAAYLLSQQQQQQPVFTTPSPGSGGAGGAFFPSPLRLEVHPLSRSQSDSAQWTSPRRHAVLSGASVFFPMRRLQQQDQQQQQQQQQQGGSAGGSSSSVSSSGGSSHNSSPGLLQTSSTVVMQHQHQQAGSGGQLVGVASGSISSAAGGKGSSESCVYCKTIPQAVMQRLIERLRMDGTPPENSRTRALLLSWQWSNVMSGRDTTHGLLASLTQALHLELPPMHEAPPACASKDGLRSQMESPSFLHHIDGLFRLAPSQSVCLVRWVQGDWYIQANDRFSTVFMTDPAFRQALSDGALPLLVWAQLMSDEDEGQTLSLYWDLVSRAGFSNSSATTGTPSVAQSSWNMLVRDRFGVESWAKCQVGMHLSPCGWYRATWIVLEARTRDTA